MFGSKARKEQRRANDLAQRLDTAHQTIEKLAADLETARYVQRTAINAREEAENIAASQRGELAARADTIRRLNGAELARENARLKEHTAALEKRLAELQAANEARDQSRIANIPNQREDGAA